jgi:F-type H+-transporting ATPase subunit epsilon
VLTVSVISPEAILFEGTTDSVVAPAFDGEVGILTGHAPMMTLLGEGQLRLGGGQRFRVQGGFLQVVDDQVRVVTEHAAKLCRCGPEARPSVWAWTGATHSACATWPPTCLCMAVGRARPQTSGSRRGSVSGAHW